MRAARRFPARRNRRRKWLNNLRPAAGLWPLGIAWPCLCHMGRCQLAVCGLVRTVHSVPLCFVGQRAGSLRHHRAVRHPMVERGRAQNVLRRRHRSTAARGIGRRRRARMAADSIQYASFLTDPVQYPSVGLHPRASSAVERESVQCIGLRRGGRGLHIHTVHRTQYRTYRPDLRVRLI